MSQESGQEKTMENKDVGVKRRLRILQDVNRFSQVVDALKRPADARVAQRLKKQRSSISQDDETSKNHVTNMFSDSRASKPSCTVDQSGTLNSNSSVAAEIIPTDFQKGKIPMSVEQEEDTESLVIDVSTRQISDTTDTNTNKHARGTVLKFHFRSFSISQLLALPKLYFLF